MESNASNYFSPSQNFFFFSHHDSTFSQRLLNSVFFTKSTSSSCYETVPRFYPQPHFSHDRLFLPDLTYFPGFPISVSGPGLSLALQVNTRQFHKDVPLKVPNVPNPSSYTASPSCSSSCHSFTHTHAYTFSEHLSWDQTLC